MKLHLSENTLAVLKRRYLRKNESGEVIETPEDLFKRTARYIASGEPEDRRRETEREYLEMMTSFRFLPNSPTLMNAGTDLGQLSACFVLPVEDSMEGIFESVKNTALIHKSGGGTGFSFSRIRPKNDLVKSTKGVSSGPISFMNVFDVATETIKQGGTRRGANMGILCVDHPDILDFISCKSDSTCLNNFNISVALTTAFMEAVAANEDFDLVSPRNGEKKGTLKARDVFELIANMAWKNGDPGVIFLDRINEDNPTPHVGLIESTNPCGEQPLLPYESCNLGSINLARFVTSAKDGFDYIALGETVRRAVRFLDTVIDLNKYPLKEIAEMTRQNRKIGLGVMGWADALIAMGIPYNTDMAVSLAEEVMEFISFESKKASVALAKERGVFENYQGSVYSKDNFKPLHKGNFRMNGQLLDWEALEESIRVDGIHNATTTTIAPTGTISIIAGCSSGVEPLFAISYVRTVMDGTELVEVNPRFEAMAKEGGFYSEELMRAIADKGTVQGLRDVPAEHQRLFVTAHDIDFQWHIKMQAAFQKFTDNAVSKTVNLHNQATVEDVENIYIDAYKHGLKGVTIYRDGSREGQVLSTGKSKKSASVESLSADEVVRRKVKRKRADVLSGKTMSVETGCGRLYVTINYDKEGLFELFVTMGKAGGCAASECEAIGRLVTLLWRYGVKPEDAVKQLIGISCHKPFGYGPNKVLSCADAIAKAIKNFLESEGLYHPDMDYDIIHPGGACFECGGIMEQEGGCSICRSCGYSICS